MTRILLHPKRFKVAKLQFAHLENLRLNFPIFFLYGFLLSLWCFSILVYYYFQVSFFIKVILYVVKIAQNTVTELLQNIYFLIETE